MLVVGGVVWAVVLLSSVAVGPTALAVVVTPVVGLGVLSAWRSTAPRTPGPDGAPRRPRLPSGARLWLLLAIGLTPLAALTGIIGVLVVLGAGAVVTARLTTDGDDRGRVELRSLAAVLAPAVAGGFLVLAGRQGTELVVVMVLAVLAFDGANSVMGRTASASILGAISGATTVLVFSIVVNALLDPPFTGSTSWVLCVLVAVCAPLGVVLCERLVSGRAPAVRRLDSLVIVAPLWWLGVVVLLHG